MAEGKTSSTLVSRATLQVRLAGLVLCLGSGLLACEASDDGFEQGVIDSLHRTIQAVEDAGEHSNGVFADGWISQHQLAFALSMQTAQTELDLLTRRDGDGQQTNCAIPDHAQQQKDGCELIQWADRDLTRMRLAGDEVFQQLGWGQMKRATAAMAESDEAAAEARRRLIGALDFYVKRMQADIVSSAQNVLRLAGLIIIGLLIFIASSLHMIWQSRRQQQQLMERDTANREYTRRLELISREVRRLRDLGSAIDATAGVLIFNPQHKVVSINKGFRQLRALHDRHVQGHSIASVLGLEDAELVDDMIASITRKEIWRGEVQGRREDGSAIWMYVLFHPELDDLEDLEGSLALVLDITESKKAQLTLARTRHLTALGEMAGGVAHEINNPLSVINGRVAVLLKKFHAQNLEPAILQSGLEQVQRTVSRIARIVDSMRRLSRTDINSEDARPGKIDAILRETLEFTEDKLSKYEIRLMIHDPLMMSEALVMLRGFGLSQILINLIANAVDAIDSESEPERWIRVELGRSSQGLVQIKVVDSGQGIAKAIRHKIMDPFFTTKPAGKGTGLGLSLSQRIAEEHGGRLTYDDEAVHTTFVLELPELKRDQEVA
ncbi:MAG: ATP-binding protein [Pseudobdellovibrionaceae bacterium]|nr:ATP-binding protein [Pseudobdellovibrionaceae bacterium]